MGLLLRLGFGKPPLGGEDPAAIAPRPARRIPVFGRGRRDPLASVVENLKLVFNTKAGYGWFLPGFGLGNYFSRAAGGEALSALVEELETNVRRFEPRLADTAITALGRDDTWIVLRLTGRLGDRDVAFGIRFDVSFGSVRVQVEDDGRR